MVIKVDVEGKGQGGNGGEGEITLAQKFEIAWRAGTQGEVLFVVAEIETPTGRKEGRWADQ